MSVERVEIGECDTPTCRNEASEFTPAGYVCPDCFRELEREHQEARRRDRAGRRND